MKKKVTSGLFILISLLTLSGCCGNHDWQEATCTEPKTCSNCKETEGEALGHIWTDANYQMPKTCSVCGMTEGPLTPSFEEYGLIINAEDGITCDYTTACREAPSKETVAHVTFTNYQNDDPVEGLEPLEGYECRAVHISVVFDDENERNYGHFLGGPGITDYYDIVNVTNSCQYNEAQNRFLFTINYYGEDYPECALIPALKESDPADGVSALEYDIYLRIPAGYDGIVLFLYNGNTTWGDGKYIYDVADEDFIFFRVN